MMSLSHALFASVAAVPIDNATQKTIVVSATEPTFSIQLDSNPTTGYRWELRSYNATFIKMVENHYVAPKTQRIGAGGHEVWTFKVLPAGFKTATQTTISLGYARPWQGGESGPNVIYKILTKP